MTSPGCYCGVQRNAKAIDQTKIKGRGFMDLVRVLVFFKKRRKRSVACKTKRKKKRGWHQQSDAIVAEYK
jgi:hypothetical protein